jgi:Clr5 domain
MDIAPVTGKVAEADWVRFKETIRDLYLVQNKPLLGNASLQQEMKERFNFCQT